MPRDIIWSPDDAAERAMREFRDMVADRADRLRRDKRAAAYIAAKLAEREEQMRTRRQVNMFCAAIMLIGAPSIIAQVW